MEKMKKTRNSKAFKPRNRYELIIFLLFFSIFLMPQTASAQIITLDPVTVGIQSIIQDISAANTAIQAAESKIEVELSALKYGQAGSAADESGSAASAGVFRSNFCG